MYGHQFFVQERKGTCKAREAVFLMALTGCPLPLCLGSWKRKQMCQTNFLMNRNWNFQKRTLRNQLNILSSMVAKKDFYIIYIMYKNQTLREKKNSISCRQSLSKLRSITPTSDRAWYITTVPSFHSVILTHKNLLGDVFSCTNGCKKGIMLTKLSSQGCYNAKQCETFGEKNLSILRF